MSSASSSQEKNTSCVYCNDDKGIKKECTEFPNIELSSPGAVLLALCHLPVAVNDILEETHIFFFPPHSIFLVRKRIWAIFKDDSFEVNATRSYMDGSQQIVLGV